MSRDDINNLVYTSVEDMKSSLDCAESEGAPYSIDVLRKALILSVGLKEKTRAKILLARIARYEKAVKE